MKHSVVIPRIAEWMNMPKNAVPWLAGILALSVGASRVAVFIGAESLRFWLAAPALVLSFWMFVGHLITLDDDAPGGWSNPENSRSLWIESLRALSLKFLLLVFVVGLVLV